MSATTPRTQREPVQARSRATQRQVVEAAVRCVGELGLSRTTMAEIASRAGISRGALQHHFPTREDLITTALEISFNERLKYLQAQAEELGEDPDAEAVLSILIEAYQGRGFGVSVQIWAAAAGDPVLRERIVPLERKVARAAHRMAVTALRADDSDPHTRTIVQATLDFARGLGLANLLTDDSRRRARVVQAWVPMLQGIARRPAAATGAEPPVVSPPDDH